MSKLSQALKKTERAISSVIPHAHSAEKRQAMQLAKEQMDYYHEAKEIAHKEADRVNTERQEETKRIQEKQIRALRSRYRSSGFLGSSSSSGDEVSNTLG